MGGSGTQALTFSYTISATDKNVTALSVAEFNLDGASIADVVGTDANLSLAGLSQSGPQIYIPPIVTQVAEIYEAVLQRAPSTDEVNVAIAEEGAIGNAGVVAILVDSPEAEQNIYPVVQIIDLATGSLPAAAQLTGWVLATESGTSFDQMATTFGASTTFGNIYNNGTAVDPDAPITAGILEAIIQHATGVAATEEQVNAWMSSGLTIDQVFVDFALGEQYTTIAECGPARPHVAGGQCGWHSELGNTACHLPIADDSANHRDLPKRFAARAYQRRGECGRRCNSTIGNAGVVRSSSFPRRRSKASTRLCKLSIWRPAIFPPQRSCRDG